MHCRAFTRPLPRVGVVSAWRERRMRGEKREGRKEREKRRHRVRNVGKEEE